MGKGTGVGKGKRGWKDIGGRRTQELAEEGGEAHHPPVDRISANHGNRSSSVKGIPRDIFSILDAGWSVSPSMKGRERERERSWPIVDLPLERVSGHARR